MSPTVTPDLPSLAKEWERSHADPPAVLYHYATAAGLMGIIGSQRLWATNARFLNDPSEIRYAFKVISDTVGEREKAYLEARSAEPTLAVLPDLMGTILGVGAPKIEIWAKDLLEVFHHQREVYVTSFRESGDLLSQWRGYAAAGGGYAIGIAAGEIWRARNTRPPVILRKVIYDPETQRRIVSRWVQSMFDLDLAWRRARRDEIRNSLQTEKEPREQTHEEEGRREQKWKAGLSNLLRPLPFFKIFRPAQEESLKRVAEIQTRVTQFLAECLISFKDPAYHEEREWRAIQFGLDAPSVKFRSRGGSIVPYVELDLTAAEGSARGRLPIRNITYGPTLEPGVSDRALKMLCGTAGYSDPEVTVCQSSIPYRGPG